MGSPSGTGLRKRRGGGGGGGKGNGSSSSSSSKNKKKNDDDSNNDHRDDVDEIGSGDNNNHHNDDHQDYYEELTLLEKSSYVGGGDNNSNLLLECAVIVALVVIVYNPLLFPNDGGGDGGDGGDNSDGNDQQQPPGFVWDDECFKDAPAIVGDSNGSIRSILQGLTDIWFHPVRGLPNEIHYWPVTYTTFWFEYNVLGWGQSSPTPYHWTNVALHAANAVLLLKFFVESKMNLEPRPAWFASLVFALHPANCDSVSWIIERKDVLSAFFYLLSLSHFPAFYDQKKKTAAVSRRKNKTYYHGGGRGRKTSSSELSPTILWSLLFYILALLSKSIVVSLPFVLILLLWLLQGCTDDSEDNDNDSGSSSILSILRRCRRQRDVTDTIPFWIAGAVITACDIAAASGREVVAFRYSVLDRMFIACRALVFYFTQLLLWPRSRSIIYPIWNLHPSYNDDNNNNNDDANHSLNANNNNHSSRGLADPDPSYIWYLCLAAVPITFLITLRMAFKGTNKDRGSNNSATNSDNDDDTLRSSEQQRRRRRRLLLLRRGLAAAWLYFVATLAPVLCLIDYGYMRYSFVADRYQYLAGIGPTTAFAYCLFRQYCRDSRNGVKTAVTVSAATMCLAYLVIVMILTYRHAAVYRNNETFYKHIVTYNPKALYAYANLGNEFVRRKHFVHAEFCYSQAERYYNLDGRHHTNYGVALQSLKKYDDSIRHLERSIEMNPYNVKAHNAAGNYYSDRKQHEKAVPYFERALEINPKYALGWNNLASELLRLGKYQAAVDAYLRAIDLDPAYIKARINVAEAYRMLGQKDDSVHQLQEVLSLDPENSIAKSRLEAALAV